MQVRRLVSLVSMEFLAVAHSQTHVVGRSVFTERDHVRSHFHWTFRYNRKPLFMCRRSNQFECVCERVLIFRWLWMSNSWWLFHPFRPFNACFFFFCNFQRILWFFIPIEKPISKRCQRTREREREIAECETKTLREVEKIGRRAY